MRRRTRFFLFTNSSVTTWVYEPATGLLLQKLDNAAKGPTYTYHPSGLHSTRQWERGILTAYQYDGAGQNTSVTYSDGTPPINHTYRRDGQRLSTTDTAGTHAFEYNNPGGEFSSESITGGLLDGVQISHGSSLGRRNAIAATKLTITRKHKISNQCCRKFSITKTTFHQQTSRKEILLLPRLQQWEDPPADNMNLELNGIQLILIHDPSLYRVFKHSPYHGWR